jgi:protein-tyrosine phosphatase
MESGFRLAIVARPRGGEWLGDELGAMRKAGIDVIVSLLTHEEASELALQGELTACQGAGLLFLNHPIQDRSVPINRTEFLAFVDCVSGLLREGKFVAIHCRAGIGRSSLLAASVLRRLGINAASAFELVQSARGCQIPDTPEQRSWVLENISQSTPNSP